MIIHFSYKFEINKTYTFPFDFYLIDFFLLYLSFILTFNLFNEPHLDKKQSQY